MPNNQQDHNISSFPLPDCINCGARGKALYHGLEDHWFGTPGVWNLKRCSNASCGLVWLDPMPSPEDIGKAYETYYTHVGSTNEIVKTKKHILSRPYQYLKNGYLALQFGYPTAISSWQEFMGLLLLFLPNYRGDIERSVNGIKFKPGGYLLEVGCGNGDFLSSMKSLGWQVAGIEVDPKAAEHAASKGIDVRLGRLEDQRYPDDLIDTICLDNVIEHVHNPGSLLTECHRILKPGGQLIINTPNLDSWGHRIFRQNWMALDPPRHLFVYSRNSLRSISQKAGFLVRVLRSLPQRAPGICGESRRISRKISNREVSGSSIPDSVIERGFFWMEWALIKINPFLGEELFLVAEKITAPGSGKRRIDKR